MRALVPEVTQSNIRTKFIKKNVHKILFCKSEESCSLNLGLKITFLTLPDIFILTQGCNQVLQVSWKPELFLSKKVRSFYYKKEIRSFLLKTPNVPSRYLENFEKVPRLYCAHAPYSYKFRLLITLQFFLSWFQNRGRPRFWNEDKRTAVTARHVIFLLAPGVCGKMRCSRH